MTSVSVSSFSPLPSPSFSSSFPSLPGMDGIFGMIGELITDYASLSSSSSLGLVSDVPVGFVTAPEVYERQVRSIRKSGEVVVPGSPIVGTRDAVESEGLFAKSRCVRGSCGALTPRLNSSSAFTSSVATSRLERLMCDDDEDVEVSSLRIVDEDPSAEPVSKWSASPWVTPGVDTWLDDVEDEWWMVDPLRLNSTFPIKSISGGYIENLADVCVSLAQNIETRKELDMVSDDESMVYWGEEKNDAPTTAEVGSAAWYDFFADARRYDDARKFFRVDEQGNFVDPFAVNHAPLRRQKGRADLRAAAKSSSTQPLVTRRTIYRENDYFDDDAYINFKAFQNFADMDVEALIAYIPYEMVDGPESDTYWYPTQPHEPGWYEYPWGSFVCTCYWCRTWDVVKPEHEVHDWCWCQHCNFMRGEEYCCSCSVCIRRWTPLHRAPLPPVQTVETVDGSMQSNSELSAEDFVRSLVGANSTDEAGLYRSPSMQRKLKRRGRVGRFFNGVKKAFDKIEFPFVELPAWKGRRSRR